MARGDGCEGFPYDVPPPWCGATAARRAAGNARAPGRAILGAVRRGTDVRAARGWCSRGSSAGRTRRERCELGDDRAQRLVL